MVVPIVGILLAFLVLPRAWGTALLVGVIIWEVAEKLFWLHLIHLYPIAVGPEALIGLSVTAASVCQPDGRVRLQGESWQARCSTGAQPGETLVVEDIERIAPIVGKRHP